MIGLVKKDLLVMRKVLKSYLSILAVMVVLAILGIYALSFAITFVSVMTMVFPITVFSYDEQAKWDGYAAALPLGRRSIVGARYLFAFLLTLAVGAIATVFCVADSIVSQSSLVENMASLLCTLGAGMFVVDILLPLCYKLGAERARPYLCAIAFIPVVVLFAVAKLGVLDALNLSQLYSWLDSLSELAVLGVFALVPLAALLGMLVSYQISSRIMVEKEF